MSFQTVIDLLDLLDDGNVSGNSVAEYLCSFLAQSDIHVKRIFGDQPGSFTDFIQVRIAGKSGKTRGGTAPTLGIIGRLGGIGARPQRKGFVSDGDGALAALAAAGKLLKMKARGDDLMGDVLVATQICPNAPTRPHDPVPFMSSCVSQYVKNHYELNPDMDAILSVDTTKGNRLIKHRGFAISPTIKEGWILPVASDLLNVIERTSGELPATFPITHQDITPYGNGLYHMNSIVQPAFGTTAPVVGVAITTESSVPGCATGATHVDDVDAVVRFMVEVAKEFTQGTLSFYDPREFDLLVQRYGSQALFQTAGLGHNG